MAFLTLAVQTPFRRNGLAISDLLAASVALDSDARGTRAPWKDRIASAGRCGYRGGRRARQVRTVGCGRREETARRRQQSTVRTPSVRVAADCRRRRRV